MAKRFRWSKDGGATWNYVEGTPTLPYNLVGTVMTDTVIVDAIGDDVSIAGVILPIITSADNTSVAEGVQLAFALTANKSVTWTITGGADAAAYEISGSTLRWVGNGTQTYNAGHATWPVQITATDTLGNTTNQMFTTTVLSSGYNPSLDFSDGQNSQYLTSI